ncbi:MAG: FHA domain-containing protein [Myxococcales bacterium]
MRVLLILAIALLSAQVSAAPAVKLLRIDPRAAQENGNPVLTTVVDISQSKRVSDATSACAGLTGNAQLDCMSTNLEKPFALYQSFPFPSDRALFTVNVEGTDIPAKFISLSRWGESQQQPGVGTSWLILIDADKRMSKSFDDAKQVAQQFVATMGPNDIVNIMFFNDREVVKDSKWIPAAQKAKATGFITGSTDTFTSSGRNRSLLTIIKKAATDGFQALGNVGEDVKVPLHQAMVVLSSGFGGADAGTTGPAALQVQQFMTQGRFPEDNTALPKAPVPVISIYFPITVIDEFKSSSLDFMQNLANTEIGGFFSVMQPGGGGRSAAIVSTVRQRFSKMNIVKWKVSCVAPTVTQSFKLVFQDTNPPILGDNTFKDVPIGIDPTAWPLDVNIEYTTEMSKRDGGTVYPGGSFKVYGDFCWGGAKERAEVYFLPAGQPIPTALTGANIETAKRTQQQLIAMGMKGTALEASDTFASFKAPDSDKILHGSGDQAVVRLVIYDNKAHRTSGVTASTIVQMKGSTAPLPLLLILGSLFGLVVVALLVVVIVRSGGKKRPAGGGGAGPMPVVAGGYGAPPAPQGYGAPPPGYGPQGYGAPPVQPHAPAPQAPPANPYGGGVATTAILTGAAGVYTILAGQEIRAGRDAAQCVIALNEPRISGVHASLKLEGGQLYVRDDNSNNGTMVNGNRLSPGLWSPVPPGSILRFGPIEFSAAVQ